VGAFVGRSSELETLLGVAEEARTGPAGALVIGEPGSGKSRLLAEARRRMRLPHAVAVVGYEAERGVPLSAASQLLRRLSEIADEGHPLEAVLFPADRSALDRLRLFEACHRAFRHLHPALLLVDDLHWIDELSFALCHYLIRGARETGHAVAVLAATRPLEAGATLVEPLDPERLRVVDLPPLSADEGVELAMAVDRGLDGDRARELHRLAQGSPFWIEALAASGGSLGGATELITARLRTASPDAAELLGVLAVAGRPIDLEGVAALTEWPPDRIRAALRELTVRGLTVSVTGRTGISHDLIREGALGQLPPQVSRRIHGRLASHLESRAGDDLGLLREALEHRGAAGLPSLELAVRLATSPRASLLGPEGVRLLATIAEGAGPLDPAAMAVNESVAALATQIGQHDEALSRWLRVAEMADTPEGRATALLAASKAAFALERGGEAREYLAASRREGTTDPVLSLEQVSHETAILLWLEQRTEEGRALARDAVAAATRLAGASGRVGGLDQRARRAYLDAVRLEYEAAVQEADGEAALRIARRREHASRGADPESSLSASIAVGVALRQTGQLHEATARFRRAWAQAHRDVLPRLAVEVGYALARALHLRGELREAEEVIVETSQLAARAGDLPRGRHRVVLAACGISLDRGPARQGLARLERETAREPNDHLRIPFHRDMAVWTARLAGPDGSDQVHLHLEAGRRCVEAVSCPRCGAELLLFSAEALARLGEAAEAQVALKRWRTLGIREDDMHPLVVGHSAALAEPDPAARATALEAALAEAERSPYAMQALWIHLDVGRALGELDPGEAIRHLQTTVERAAARDAGTVQDLAGRALRTLGVRTWRRGSGGAPLTAREEEVGRLVVEGATNREIAQTLFLATKTVERHVSNLLRKLGARNRTELAARLGEPKDAGDPR
jgi:DNA-binding CsgD family transcriptional regulator